MVVLLLIILVCDVFPLESADFLSVSEAVLPLALSLGAHILHQRVKTCSPNWFCCL